MLPSDDLVEQVTASLLTSASDEQISERLLELFGLDRIDLVGETLSRRQDLITEVESRNTTVRSLYLLF